MEASVSLFNVYGLPDEALTVALENLMGDVMKECVTEGAE